MVHLFRDVTEARALPALVAERLFRATAAPPPLEVELTRRELRVLRLVAGGANTRTIADRLHVSPATVRNHVQNLLGKLGPIAGWKPWRSPDTTASADHFRRRPSPRS